MKDGLNDVAMNISQYLLQNDIVMTLTFEIYYVALFSHTLHPLYERLFLLHLKLMVNNTTSEYSDIINAIADLSTKTKSLDGTLISLLAVFCGAICIMCIAICAFGCCLKNDLDGLDKEHHKLYNNFQNLRAILLYYNIISPNGYNRPIQSYSATHQPSAPTMLNANEDIPLMRNYSTEARHVAE